MSNKSQETQTNQESSVIEPAEKTGQRTEVEALEAAEVAKSPPKTSLF